MTAKPKRTLAGLSKKLFEEEEQPQEEQEKEKVEIQVPKTEEKPKEEKETPQPDPSDQDEETLEDGFLIRFKKKKQKPTMEETHTRRTFFIRNDLDKQLRRLYKKYGHGFYTDFITEAIENQLKVIEKEESQMKKK